MPRLQTFQQIILLSLLVFILSLQGKKIKGQTVLLTQKKREAKGDRYRYNIMSTQ